MKRLRRALLRTPVAVALLALAIGLGFTLISCEQEPGSSPASGPTKPPKPTKLTFGVWGTDPEIQAYQGVVNDYNAHTQASAVELVSWPDHETMREELEEGAARPDLFMISRRDLPGVVADGANVPLLDLLDERGVDYGDSFSREALLAMAGDNEQQCMPYGVSPMVIYYNTRLVDFDKMRERGLPAPDEESENARWSFEMFAAAAEFATRPRSNTSGFYIPPTVQALAPFIYSGGGKVFDDEEEPTSLAFSDEGSREALSESLELLRNPQLTLSDEQLERATPLQWFKRGKLAMMEGFRDLTPELRAVSELRFDVIPMPVLDSEATVGDVTGLCISSDADSVAKTADFLVDVISDESFARVAEAGHLVPANLRVALSDAFLQSGQQPEHAAVFNAAVRRMRLAQPIDDPAALDEVVETNLRLLLTIPVIDDLESLTSQIDEQSRSVLDPEYQPESDESAAEPSEGASPEPVEP